MQPRVKINMLSGDPHASVDLARRLGELDQRVGGSGWVYLATLVEACETSDPPAEVDKKDLLPWRAGASRQIDWLLSNELLTVRNGRLLVPMDAENVDIWHLCALVGALRDACSTSSREDALAGSTDVLNALCSQRPGLTRLQIGEPRGFTTRFRARRLAWLRSAARTLIDAVRVAIIGGTAGTSDALDILASPALHNAAHAWPLLAESRLTICRDVLEYCWETHGLITPDIRTATERTIAATERPELRPILDELRNRLTERPHTAPSWMLRADKGPAQPATALPRLPGPRPATNIVLHPDTLRVIVDQLSRCESAALVGPSGYGKTVLAQQLIRHPKILQLFSDQIYWISVGRDLSSFSLAQRLNDITFLIDGNQPNLADPVLAFQYLVGVLGNRRALLVFDDIWQGEWRELLSFLTSRCPVLLTTRDGSILDDVIHQHMISDPSTQLGARVLGHMVPQLESFDCERISALVKARPFVLDIVGAQLRLEIGIGRPAGEVADALLDRMRDMRSGIDELITSVAGPNATVTAGSLVSWSLERLTADQYHRLLFLTVFQSDQDVPLRVLATLWEVDELDALAVANALRARSLISRLTFRDGGYYVGLHDIVLEHLRDISTTDEQSKLHRRLIVQTTGVEIPTDEDTLRRLGDVLERDSYLSENMVWHLSAFLDEDELAAVVTDPEIIGAKISSVGPGAVLADLASLSIDSDHAARIGALQGFVTNLRHLDRRSFITNSLHSFLANFAGRSRTAEARYIQIFSFRTSNETELHGSILSCAIGSDDDAILATTSNGMVAKLRKTDLSLIWQGDIPGGWARACAYVPDGFIVGSDDGLIRRFSERDTHVTQVFVGHKAEVRSLAVSPDGTWFVSAADDSTVRQWDLKTGQQLKVLVGHGSRVRDVEVSPDGKWLASASDDGTVRIWDVSSGQLKNILEGHTSRVRAVAISTDGERVVSVSDDGAVLEWPADEFDSPPKLVGRHNCVIRDVEFADSEHFVTAGAHDALVAYWSVVRPMEWLRDLRGHTSWVMCCRASQSGDWCVSGSDDGSVRLWSLGTGEQMAIHQGRNEWIFALAPDAGTGRLYAGTTAGRVLELERDGQGWEVRSEVRLDSGCRGVMLTESDRVVVTTDSGRLLTLSREFGLEQDLELKLSGRSVRRVNSGQLDGCFVTCCHSGNLYVLRLDDAGQIAESEVSVSEGGSIYEARLLSQAELICSVHESGHVRVHTLNGHLLDSLQVHAGPSLTIDVEDQRALCVTGGDDGKVVLVAVGLDGTLRVIRTLTQHNDWVSQVLISPDRSKVASVSDDHTLRVTEISSGRVVTSLAFEQPLYSVAWYGSSRELTVGGGSGIYYVDGL